MRKTTFLWKPARWLHRRTLSLKNGVDVMNAQNWRPIIRTDKKKNEQRHTHTEIKQKNLPADHRTEFLKKNYRYIHPKRVLYIFGVLYAKSQSASWKQRFMLQSGEFRADPRELSKQRIRQWKSHKKLKIANISTDEARRALTHPELTSCSLKFRKFTRKIKIRTADAEINRIWSRNVSNVGKERFGLRVCLLRAPSLAKSSTARVD